MYELPTKIFVKGRQFNIRCDGDYRMVLDCFSTLNDEELSEDYRVLACLIIFYNEFNSIEELEDYSDYIKDLTNEMFKFMHCGQEESVGSNQDVKLLDWDKDSTLICAAINNVAKTEIRALKYLHWWTYMGYYLSIGDSVLSNVVGIRDKIAHHKKLEEWEKDFKKSNPQYFVWDKTTAQDREAETLLRNIWNSGR